MTTTRRAAVVGDPVGHSLSPALHNAAYAALGLTGHEYEAVRVPDGELEPFLRGMGPEWLGLSVTMPHKKAALAAADVVEPLAATVGAANTLLPQPGGLLVAANTDVYGVAEAIRETRRAAGASERLSSAVVLGAGGTAAAALAALAELGATAPTVCVRSSARAADLMQAAHRMGVDVTLRRFDHASRFVLDADVVVQTAVAGAADAVAAELAQVLADSRGGLRPDQVLLDAIYDPWPTELARVWADGGGSVAPGWLMLLHQAAEQVRLMTGLVAPVEAMRDALVRALGPHEPAGR
ncbi:MAG: shikimate dehydrogenase [Micrococcales bacterium 73-15]|uniref:shikimate dehydrogenase n=1 Tax=Salana multivorans TaxID=120377 RepID=UPI00095DC87C|nr:shikimate dehydrogenase [Salana multivorans]OJX94369.1 MAG: shikimate dehydrogenase [Micrococcales bacterium 73-15]